MNNFDAKNGACLGAAMRKEDRLIALPAHAGSAALYRNTRVIRPCFAALQRLNNFQTLAEPLKMNDFTLAQETERVEQLRIVRQRHQVLIGCTRLLLCCKILHKICNRVSGALDVAGREGHSVGIGRINSVIVHRIVPEQARCFNFFQARSTHALVNHRANHLPMC